MISRLNRSKKILKLSAGVGLSAGLIYLASTNRLKPEEKVMITGIGLLSLAGIGMMHSKSNNKGRRRNSQTTIHMKGDSPKSLPVTVISDVSEKQMIPLGPTINENPEIEIETERHEDLTPTTNQSEQHTEEIVHDETPTLATKENEQPVNDSNRNEDLPHSKLANIPPETQNLDLNSEKSSSIAEDALNIINEHTTDDVVNELSEAPEGLQDDTLENELSRE